jgi:hypothetical protein
MSFRRCMNGVQSSSRVRRRGAEHTAVPEARKAESVALPTPSAVRPACVRIRSHAFDAAVEHSRRAAVQTGSAAGFRWSQLAQEEVDGAVRTEVRREVRDVGVNADVAAAARDRCHELEGNMEEERLAGPAANEEQRVPVGAPVAVLGGHDTAELSVSAGDRPAGDVVQRHGLT